MQTTVNDAFSDWIEVAAAARLLNVHPSTVIRWYQTGKLTRLKLGGRNRVSLKELATLLEPAGEPSEAARRLSRREQDRQTNEMLRRAGYRV